MYENLSAKFTTITPVLAKDILESNIMNRPLNQTTVQDYENQLRKGLWRLNGEPIIVSSGGVLLDGQHRLKACVNTGIPFETLFVSGVPEEAFPTIGTGRGRTAGDILSIAGVSDYGNKAGIITRYFNLVKGDTTFNTKEGLRKTGVSKGEVLRFYQENTGLVDHVNQVALKCYSRLRLFSRGIIGGYMLYLIVNKYHPVDTVMSFFLELFSLREPTNTGISVLRTTLLHHITGQRVITPTLRHVYVTKTWNAYVTGKQLKALRYNKEVEGTVHMI